MFLCLKGAAFVAGKGGMFFDGSISFYNFLKRSLNLKNSNFSSLNSSGKNAALSCSFATSLIMCPVDVCMILQTQLCLSKPRVLENGY